jgi:hypothetical protein
MNLRAVCVAFALIISSGTAFGADNPVHGTWKQNLSKSKFTPGPAPTSPATLRIETEKTGEMITVERVDADGKTNSYSYKGLYDGTPQKVSGSSFGDTVTLKQINSSTVEINWTRDGKTSRTSTRTVSKDGKTMTVRAKGTDAKGQPYSSVSVFEKQ